MKADTKDILEKTELQVMTEWLRDRVDLINMSEISRRLLVHTSELRRAVLGLENSKGSISKIPERCLPELRKIIDTFNEAPKSYGSGTTSR